MLIISIFIDLNKNVICEKMEIHFQKRNVNDKKNKNEKFKTEK